jgi:hypothetical protein
VFTAHGSEHALARFMAIIDALASFVKDRGDALRSVRRAPLPPILALLPKPPRKFPRWVSADRRAACAHAQRAVVSEACTESGQTRKRASM